MADIISGSRGPGWVHQNPALGLEDAVAAVGGAILKSDTADRGRGYAARFRPGTKSGGGGGAVRFGPDTKSGGRAGGGQLVPEGGISYEWGGRPPQAYAGSGAVLHTHYCLEKVVRRRALFIKSATAFAVLAVASARLWDGRGLPPRG